MIINIPEFCLILLIGVSSSGKSSFAKKHFLNTEIISSDFCRAYVADDEKDQSVTGDAFEILHFITEKRLKNRKLTVIDATNLHASARKSLQEIAKKYYCQSVALFLDVPENILKERHANRTDRDFDIRVIDRQLRDFRNSLSEVGHKNFKGVYKLKLEDIESTQIIRNKMYMDKKEENPPFDIIGDIHGCFDELYELVLKLGYNVEIIKETKIVQDEINNEFKEYITKKFIVSHPENRRLIFVGDLIDRGPNSPDVLRFVMDCVESNLAFCVIGNHEAKFIRKLTGSNVKLTHGLQQTVDQLALEDETFMERVKTFMSTLKSHHIFDNGKLVVSHAGIREEMQGRHSGSIKAFCMYGDTTGETDEFGLPVRLNWAIDYKGKPLVAYGHTPVPTAEFFNNTIDLDTGCVFGGALSALRYPEREIVEVKAKTVYYEPIRPLITEKPINKDQNILNINDVLGKKIIDTFLMRNILIREENSIKALEVMSRFAVNPKWLIYLPPTMSPVETSNKKDYLEYPIEVFNYYKKNKVEKVVCEEKHMGSRAVIIVTKDFESTNKVFGINEETLGVCYTRTGRKFFNNKNIENELLEKINKALTKADFWDKFNTTWVCLDCEIMPWSFKALDLVKNQYASVGIAGKIALDSISKEIEHLKQRNLDVSELEKIFLPKKENISKFIASYKNYCQEVDSINDIKVAPFHILATEKNVYKNKSNLWHMENIADFCEYEQNILLKTKFLEVNTNNEDDIEKACKWWEELTSTGGEGFVVKPFDFLSFVENSDFIQPAIKCRGKEYLRIIYGADYTLEQNLTRLKERGLGKKRNLAKKEFALGLEALERFVRKESLTKVHECVFGVLALESEEVDPRL